MTLAQQPTQPFDVAQDRPSAGFYDASEYPQGYAWQRERERQEAYLYAYAALEIISQRVERDVYHFWHCDGKLLRTMDEIERALELGELAAGEWAG